MTNTFIANEKLERSLGMAQAAIDHASDGIAWISSDARIVEANLAYCNFFGYSRAEMLTMRIPDFDPHFQAEQWDLHWQELRKHKRLIFETQSITKSGQLIDVEVVANLVVFDNEEFNCAFLRDITQRQHAEHQLHLLETCVARLNDIILITEAEPIDGDGPRIVFVNQAFERRTGYTSAEVLGKSPRILQGPKTNRQELDRVKKALQQWQPIRTQLLNYTKSGAEFWVEIEIVPIANALGWFTHWVAVERDITERMLQDQRKLEFISTVSHELRTPLTSILGSLGLVTGGVFAQDLEKAQSMIKMAHENSQRLSTLINDLLDVQKMEAGMMHFHFEICPLEVLLRQSIEINLPFAQRLSVHLVLAGQACQAQVLVDIGRFQQAMSNLISNACKYSHHGGMVSVQITHPAANKISIEVHDQGSGIDPEFRQRIFQKFAQADSSDSRAKGGTGLGLAITKEIVQQMHGELNYRSEVGIGSVFFITLPLCDGSVVSM